jgi:hypothetical protein
MSETTDFPFIAFEYMQDTYINLRTEGGVRAVLQLALMVSCVTDTQTGQWRRQISLGGPVVQTEAPTTTKGARKSFH